MKQLITRQHIKYICDYLNSNFPDKDRVFYKFGLATEILRVLVGNEWTDQVVFSKDHPIKSKTTARAVEFFKSKETEERDVYKFQARVSMFAERLFNLQNVTGISRIIDATKSGDINLGYSEIEAGIHLYSRDIPFQFVIGPGEKRKDFDILIQDEDLILNCEVKHKIEKTELSKETLLATFSAAKSQVPLLEPALFIIKIPEDWTKDPDVSICVDSSTKKFFMRSENILGIMFRWEERSFSHEGDFCTKFRFIKNPHFNGNANFERIINKLNGKASKRITLDELLDEFLKKKKWWQYFII
jgi:hypothetical protein